MVPKRGGDSLQTRAVWLGTISDMPSPDPDTCLVPPRGTAPSRALWETRCHEAVCHPQKLGIWLERQTWELKTSLLIHDRNSEKQE